jgi:uncharacterized pyridoxamine 5'-phosphate oxidase family protein
MKLTNKDIQVLVLSLSPLELNVSEASARRRFLRILKEADEVRQEFTTEIQDKYATKKDGKKVVVENKLQFTPENKKKFSKEMKELFSLEVEISTKGNEKDVQTIIEVLNNQIKSETESNIKRLQSQEDNQAKADNRKAEKVEAKFNTDLFEYLESLKDVVALLK